MKIALLKGQTFHMCMDSYVVYSVINFNEEPIEFEIHKVNHIMFIRYGKFGDKEVQIFGNNYEVLDEFENIIGSDSCD